MCRGDCEEHAIAGIDPVTCREHERTRHFLEIAVIIAFLCDRLLRTSHLGAANVLEPLQELVPYARPSDIVLILAEDTPCVVEHDMATLLDFLQQFGTLGNAVLRRPIVLAVCGDQHIGVDDPRFRCSATHGDASAPTRPSLALLDRPWRRRRSPWASS